MTAWGNRDKLANTCAMVRVSVPPSPRHAGHARRTPDTPAEGSPQILYGATFSKKVLAQILGRCYITSCNAGLAQLVARNLAKVEVAGSNPVARSTIYRGRLINRPFT